MSRYRRINIDGQSLFKTETRLAATALLPGTFAVINANDKFAAATTAGVKGRLYVIGAAEHQGLGVRDAVPADNSAVGNYVEEGRELAILCPAGTYKKDTPISVVAGGKGAIGTDVTCVGYSQDEVVLTADDFIRVRMRVGGATA